MKETQKPVDLDLPLNHLVKVCRNVPFPVRDPLVLTVYDPVPCHDEMCSFRDLK